MFTAFEINSDSQKFARECNHLSEQLLANLKPSEKNFILSADSCLELKPNTLCRLVEGNLSYQVNFKTLLFFEQGDLITEQDLDPSANIKIKSDFAVKLDIYSADDFFNQIRNSTEMYQLWAKFLKSKQNFWAQIATQNLVEEEISTPKITRYKAGDLIITQGQAAREVYTLLEGHAEVFVDKVKVGEVLKDELFGVIAALTESNRSADVVATTNCMTISIDREKFIDLLKSRPHTVVKLISDMSRSMLALNDLVVKYKKNDPKSDRSVLY